MQTFSMQCTCGDVMTCEAGSKEEAVEKLKGMMTQDAMAKHFAEKHSGQPMPTLEQAHAMIAQNTMPA